MPWGGPIDRTKLWCLTYTGFADSFFDKLFTIMMMMIDNVETVVIL